LPRLPDRHRHFPVRVQHPCRDGKWFQAPTSPIGSVHSCGDSIHFDRGRSIHGVAQYEKRQGPLREKRPLVRPLPEAVASADGTGLDDTKIGPAGSAVKPGGWLCVFTRRRRAHTPRAARRPARGRRGRREEPSEVAGPGGRDLARGPWRYKCRLDATVTYVAATSTARSHGHASPIGRRAERPAHRPANLKMTESPSRQRSECTRP
jgi:hypothetical protein